MKMSGKLNSQPLSETAPYKKQSPLKHSQEFLRKIQFVIIKLDFPIIKAILNGNSEQRFPAANRSA